MLKKDDKGNAPAVITVDNIIAAIRDALSPDLLSAKWNAIVARSAENSAVAGHCAIATEALYDILGGGLAGYTPFVCAYYYDWRGERHFGQAPDGGEQMTHWWLRAPDGSQRGKGQVLDATVRQYRKAFPYEKGRSSGFMSPTPPSRRARILIARVEKRLGAKKIAAFREAQIAAYKKSGGKTDIQIAMQRRRSELAGILQRYKIKSAF